MIRRAASVSLAVFLVALAMHATTFVVPKDRYMVSVSKAIVIGKVVASYTQLNEKGGVETFTQVEIDEIIKGSISDQTITVREPGGKYGDQIHVAVSAPRFRDGEHVLLFVNPLPGDRWVVVNLVLGKFTLAKDGMGRNVAIRQEEDIHGWTVDGLPHRERRRDAAKFISFIRAVEAGAEVDDEAHFLPAEEEVPDEPGRNAGSDSHSTFTASSYLFTSNIRWPSFPVTYTHTNTVAGAPNGGVTAITTAMGLWTNDTGSNVNLTHGGLDASKTTGTFGRDNANAIRWEVDLTPHGAPGPYVCGSGGVLGFAQILSRLDGLTHTGPDSAVFTTAAEGDVDMNQGLANCTSFFNSTTFVNSVTHELGHTIGFRHSDQNGSFGTCNGAVQECATGAVMESTISNSLTQALQSWDVNAVRAAYPNSAVTPPTAPAGLTATATSTTTVSVSWTASPTATSYKVFRRTAPGAYTQVGTTSSTSFGDTGANGVSANTGYQYVVRATNEGGDSGDSNSDFTVTTTFTDASLTNVQVKAVHFTELATAVNALRTLAGLSAFTFAQGTPATGGIVRKSHVDDLRTALNAARTDSDIGAAGVTFGETIVLNTTTIKSSHIPELRNGVI